MSNRRKPRLMAPPASVNAPHWHPHRDKKLCRGESLATMAGVVGNGHIDSDVQYARQTTHDNLISMLGDRRRSGVWWTAHTGDEAITVVGEIYADDTLVEDMDRDDSSRLVEVREETLRWLNENDHAVLVVAWAIGEVPEGAIL